MPTISGFSLNIRDMCNAMHITSSFRLVYTTQSCYLMTPESTGVTWEPGHTGNEDLPIEMKMETDHALSH